MKEVTKHETLTGERAERQWRGYSIDELERRRLVTTVKIDLVKEQIAIAYRGMTMPAERSGGGMNLGEQFDKMMTYATYGMQFVKVAKRIISMYRSFKSIFSSKSSAVQPA